MNKDRNRVKIICLWSFIVTLLIGAPIFGYSQNPTKSYNAGSYIIDMGQPTQTIANGLKPYGLVYALVTAATPVLVDWSINSSKAKDGKDFTANGKDYKGGSFIIPVEQITPAVTTLITTWKTNNAGLTVDGPIPVSFTAPVYKTLSIWPRAFLDAANDQLIQPYYTNAGVPTASYISNANPNMLPQCGSASGNLDVYILPHADPQNWTDSWILSLQNFINNGGAMWAGCHAVSAMENIPGCNFLSNNGLVLWGNHSNGTPPYTYASSGNPLMQFMGILDGATTNGSEQIYVPGVSGWRNTTTLAVYDLNYANTKTGITYPNTAAIIAYGPAFGNKGLVMYEAGHQLNQSGSIAEQVAAQRAFFNFLLLAGGQPQTNVTPPNISDHITTTCSDTSFVVNPSEAPANTTYTWSTPAGTGFTGGSAQTTPQASISQTLTNTTTSTVTATYTVTPQIGGCQGSTFTVTVTILAPPLLSSTLTPAAICSGTTFSYSATSGAPGATFSWTRAAVTEISNAAGSDSNGNISEILNNTTAAPVVVTYKITIAAYGCSNTQNVTVIVNPLPAAPSSVSATPASICAGGSTNLKATSAGNTIRWYTVATGGSIIGTSASGANFPVSPASTTTYYAEALIATGCSSATRTAVTVTVNPLPVLSSTLNPAAICSGTIFSYTATSAGATFSWKRAVVTGISNPAGSGPNGNISETLINTTTTPVVVTYVITITANGCSNTQNVTVTVNAAPTILSLTGSTICTSPGGTGTITSSTSVSGVNYQLYNGSAVAQGTALSGTGSGLTWTGLAAGTGYYAIGTNTTTSCTSKSGTVNIGTYTNPAAVAGSNSPVCVGSSLTLTGGPGSMTAYSWTGPSSYSNSSQSPTVSSGATTAMGGTYSLTVTDNHGCQGTASVTAIVNAPPVINSFDPSGTTTCTGSSAVVTVSSTSLVTGIYTVTYNVSGINTVPTTTASMSFTAGSPGTGTFVTSALNTIGTTNVVNITAIAFSATPLCASSVSTSTPAFTTQSCAPGSCIYDTNGTYNFSAPAGVTSIIIQAWGAGGGGEVFISGIDAGAGGGGGGAFTSLTYSSVIPGTQYAVVVGKGGAPGVAGTNSTFNGTTVKAVGGGSNSTADCHGCTNNGGTGGLASACIPSSPPAYSGGNGGTGGPGGAGKHGGGGGGGSAGSGSIGGNGSNYNGDTGGTGGTAGTGTPGGASGGAGGSNNLNGSNGNVPGGGGGGASWAGSTSGSGADGQVIITYTCPNYTLTGTSSTSPCIGNEATVTLNGTLPVGTYMVNYSLSGSNTALGSIASMTVTSAGTGTFTTSELANSGNTTITVTNLSSGSCSVCSSPISSNNTASFTVNPNSVGGTAAASPSTICYNSATSITVSGYTGTIQWQQSPYGSTNWTNVSGGSGATSDTYTTPALTATTYYRAVVTSGTCSSANSTTASVTVNALPTITGTTPASICGPGTVTLGATASAGTINWYAALSGGVSLGTGTSFTTPILSSTTTYYAEASANGCVSATRTAVTATVNAIPIVSTATVSPAAVCASGQVVFSATPSSGTITWYDSPTNGNLVVILNPAISETTTYYAEASANGCISVTRTAVMATVYPLPSINGNLIVCVGSTTQLNGSGLPAITNPWASDAPGVATISNTGLVTGVSSGTSLITYTDYNGCIQTATVTINALPTITGITPASICGTGTVTISATPDLGETIDWYDASGGGTLLLSGNVNFTTPILSATTNYYAQARNMITGCISVTRTMVTATVNPLPTVISASVSPTAVCASGQVTFSATPGTGTITWYDDPTNGYIVTVLNPTISETTTYYAEASVNGCVSVTRAAVTATVNSLPSVTLISVLGTDGQTVCLNSAITNIAYLVGGGATGATVSGLPSGITGNYISGVYTISGSPTVSGTYSYIVITSGSGACPAVSSNGNIYVNTISPGSISKGALNPGPDCAPLDPNTAGSSIDATGSGAITYSWEQSTDNQVSWQTASGNSTTNYRTFNPDPMTITTSLRRDATSTLNGITCTDYSNVLTYIVYPLPTVSSILPGGPIPNVCVNSQITLTNATPGGVWSTSDGSVATVSGGVVTGTGAGSVTISYTVTDGNGCSKAANRTVKINSLPTTSPIYHR